MILPGARRQSPADQDLLDFSGTITSGGTAQALLPQQPGRCYLLIQNISDTTMTVGIGPARGTATISGGKVTAVTVNNAGLGYVLAPKITFLGGLIAGNYDLPEARSLGAGFKPAKASCVLSSGGVGTVTVSDGGAGYLVAPTVWFNNPLPELGGGAILPSATEGIQLLGSVGAAVIMDASMCPTSAVNIFCATTSKAFICKVGL